jgi:predicted class III extradiol MEMO1 family dioxygenase
MKKIVATILVMLCFVSLSACAKAPRCADNQVKKLILDICSKKVTDDFDAKIIADMDSSHYNLSAVDQKIAKDAYNKYITRGDKNEILNDIKKCSVPQIKEKIKTFEENRNGLSLESIRIVSTDNNIKKCSCEADLVIDKDNKKQITYNAQKTEDGKLRVETSYE